MSETTTPVKSIEDMTPEEIKAYLAKKEKATKAKKAKEMAQYVSERDSMISELIQEALELEQNLKTFKAKVHASMDEQKEKLDAYGKIRSNSKGGFHIIDKDGLFMVKRRRDTEPRWDERSDKGVALIKDFLGDKVKKRDRKTYTLIMGFLEKNANGDLEHARVMELLKHEDLYNDDRWVEGCHLVKEGYSSYLKAFGYELKTKVVTEENPTGKWQNIILSFSAL